jgi:hypothetical protein
MFRSALLAVCLSVVSASPKVTHKVFFDMEADGAPIGR